MWSSNAHARSRTKSNSGCLTGFNDIFVSIAAAILLFAVGWIGQSIGQATGLYVSDNGEPGPSFLAPLAIAITSWGLALFFTAKRRMALAVDPSPSRLRRRRSSRPPASSSWRFIGPDRFNNDNQLLGATVGGVSAALAAAAAWLHWRRFHVPITVAAGAAAVAGLFLAIVLGIVQPARRANRNEPDPRLRACSSAIGVFLFAMWWDASDRARVTRRSDVAFWLHLLAAPMIAHPIFTLMGLNNGVVGTGEALVVVGLYVAVRPDGAGDRSPRFARLGARLRALRADRAVQAVSARSSSTSR